MIVENTYWSAECDSCGVSYTNSMPTRELQIEHLRKHDWWIGHPTSNAALCSDCLRSFHGCVKAFGMTPADAAGVITPAKVGAK